MQSLWFQPLSELKKQLWDKICPQKESQSHVEQQLDFNGSSINDLGTQKLNNTTSVENEQVNALKVQNTPVSYIFSSVNSKMYFRVVRILRYLIFFRDTPDSSRILPRTTQNYDTFS